MNKEELLKAIDEGIKILAKEPTETQIAFENGCKYTINNFQHLLSYCDKLEKENTQLKSVIKEIRELIYENLFDKEEKYHYAISEIALDEVTDKMLQILDKGDK